jgi:hypothetical protein
MLHAGTDGRGQLFDGLRLVAGGRVIGDEFKHAQKLGVEAKRVKRWAGLNLNPVQDQMVKRTPHPGPLPIGSADAEREKRSLRLGEATIGSCL